MKGLPEGKGDTVAWLGFGEDVAGQILFDVSTMYTSSDMQSNLYDWCAQTDVRLVCTNRCAVFEFFGPPLSVGQPTLTTAPLKKSEGIEL